MRRLSILILFVAVTGAAQTRIYELDQAGKKPDQLGIDLPDQIAWTDPRPNDVFFPVNVNNWFGFMNQRGNLILYPQFDWLDDFYDSLARAQAHGKTGYIKIDGEWVIPPDFVYADRFAQGRAVVGDGKLVTFIDKTGKPITQARFDAALRFHENVAAVQKDGLCGFINLAGDVTIPLRYKQVRSFYDGFAAVRFQDPESGQDAVGYIDKRGQPVFTDTTGQIQALGDFHDGLARIKGNDLWGYLGKNWKLRIDARYEDARDFHQGIAAVRLNQKWGFIDKTGRFVIQPVYDSADDFDDKLIMVTLDKKIGYVDRIGNVVIKPQFKTGKPFDKGLAEVGLTTSFGYIDTRGKLKWSPTLALKGFINRRAKEKAYIAQQRTAISNRIVDPPAEQAKQPTPYPPDYLYDPVLPQPVH